MAKQVIDEDALAAYAAQVEGDNTKVDVPSEIQMPKTGVGNADAIQKMRAENAKAKANQMSMSEEHALRVDEMKQQARDAGVYLVPVDLESLPSKGMFYPIGTRVFIMAAKTHAIKRWTTMVASEQADIAEKIQDILESCTKISLPDGRRGNWRDLIDIDRMYLIFAIHDVTFPEGTNDIMVKIDETNDIVLNKDNVDYVKFSDKLLKFYNAEKRCFSLPTKHPELFKETNGTMDIYMPTLGVSNWMIDYMQACNARQENYDESMIAYAMMITPDWRSLEPDSYYRIIQSTNDWTTYEWTLISRVRDLILDAAITPRIRYVSGGTEHETVLNFRRGIKGIFEQKLDIDL